MTSFHLHYFRQPDKTKVIYIIQTDLKGRIPIKLIESALPTMQLSFFSSVRKAIKDGILDKWTSVSVFHPYLHIHPSKQSCDCHMTTQLFLSDAFLHYIMIQIYITVSSIYCIICVQFIFLSEISSAWKPWILTRGKILVWGITVIVPHLRDQMWFPLNFVQHQFCKLFITRPHTAIAR